MIPENAATPAIINHRPSICELITNFFRALFAPHAVVHIRERQEAAFEFVVPSEVSDDVNEEDVTVRIEGDNNTRNTVPYVVRSFDENSTSITNIVGDVSNFKDL